ncbi:MAG: hypothetical protein A2061_09505 [Gallionellales bacterium GWA2_59_43]|nr:MAG: hypothetical protein A2061_09505 [Gallionellales bacterium GWA2_59_43]
MHRIKAGDYDTREQLVASNLLHVLRSNKHYARSGTKIFDLIKAGNQGLVHALESFDAEGNDRFSTYAATYIQQHVERALNPRPVPPARTALPQNGSPGIQPQSV